nr:dicer-1 [Amrasca biguttula biguttula]
MKNLFCRAICDYEFRDLEEKEKIHNFSSPKVLRLIEIISNFKPKTPPETKSAEDSQKKEIENAQCLEKSLSNLQIASSKNDHQTVIDKFDDKSIDTNSKVIESNQIDSKEVPVSMSNGVVSKADEIIICDQSKKDSICIVSEKDNLSQESNLECINGKELAMEDQPVLSQIEQTIEDKLETNECETLTEDETSKNAIPTQLESKVENSPSIDSLVSENGSSQECQLTNISSDSSVESELVSEKMNPVENELASGSQCTVNAQKLTNGVPECTSSDSSPNTESITDKCSEHKNPKIESPMIVDVDHTKEDKQQNGELETTGKNKWKGRSRVFRHTKRNFPSRGTNRTGSQEDAEQLCAIIFVQHPFTAKILFHLFNELRRCDPNFAFLSPQYTVGKTADPITEPREAEIEHRKQEEVLKRFRIRECNVLISTSILEEGIDLPKCNLVVRYDVPTHYRSYAQSKGRARTQDSHFLTIVEQTNTDHLLSDLAQFIEIDRMLLSRCSNREPTEEEEAQADKYISCVKPFVPGNLPVTLSMAITLVNRYCAKLPSDTFTRLTPLWSIHPVRYQDQDMFYCKVRLPINSPVKPDIMGHPMPSPVLAKRVAALEVVQVLHSAKELDDNLQPIGKESFHSLESELVEEEEGESEMDEPRPGTTKRRQYYYKRIASSLSDCRPLLGQPALLYHLDMVLTCPLPEEQNTRGRKLYPPEEAPQGFGILTLKPIPKICPFPIFTRSGEVCVSLSLQQQELLLTEDHLEMIAVFLNYTFTSVLRLQKYLMLFDPDASENCYFIVPTKKGEGKVLVDWEFLNLIYFRREEMPHLIPDEERENFVFDASKYHDAVVMPWYRNQDQPQYFYVAEICNHLNPKSSFPGSDYQTFEEYYQKKYSITVQNKNQPLLDVDHTSARLNFLTPRYVNRKGVALPTSSEETKRAKRENLEQKQILVPELCMIHPFPASLWRQAVCLPCVLYRINALLLAGEIRTTVAREIQLGQQILAPDFEWRPLDFGWSLADVLKKSKEESEKVSSKIKNSAKIIELDEPTETTDHDNNDEELTNIDETDSEVDKLENEEKDEFVLEIGTWSNEMAEGGADTDSGQSSDFSKVRYGSPTTWDYPSGPTTGGLNLYDSDMESDVSDSVMSSDSESSESQPRGGLKITFRGDFLAEAEEDDIIVEQEEKILKQIEWHWQESSTLDDLQKEVEQEVAKFEEATKANKEMIVKSGMLLPCGTPFTVVTDSAKTQPGLDSQSELGFQLSGYAMPSGVMDQVTSSLDSISPCKSSLDSAIDSESELSSDASTIDSDMEKKMEFSFDEQPDLKHHPGPSPSLLLQALTMSNANDGINLERLETIGDSFLKYAITTYLYCAYDTVHEGKLSHLRSKQVSNLNLYRLGKRKQFGESMIATKFEPHDNWLPPCYLVPREVERALVEAGLPACLWNQAELPTLRGMTRDEIIAAVKDKVTEDELDLPCFVPYNLITQHSIPDKSIADCVEALIGAYLIACGPRGALLFMSWLGIRVLPSEQIPDPHTGETKINYGELKLPKSPLLRHVPNPEGELNRLLDGFSVFEHRLKYRFRDRSYLLQAMTHASYSPNRLTDCYQRLEFLGDAVLDYLITRHLYEDKRQHCPGALTDLRSALVNNTIFASLAVRHGFHKFFRHLSPGLAEVVDRFVRIQEENCHAISEEYYLIGEEECEEAEDVEVPKALGDVFESVAGAIFLDSGMSLDAVWKVYYSMMKNEIEQFSTNVPKSPIRELLELEPETAKFGKPEKLADGRRVRVTVEVFGKGIFKGIGRNYRIAKCTAAKCALRQLKKRGLLARKLNTVQMW